VSFPFSEWQLTPSSNILAGLAGITSDANSLVNFARNSAQRHLYSYDEDIPVEMLVQRLCDMKQGYTQFGGKFQLIARPRQS
jgi:20S proteasome subunit alpha 3